MNFKKVKLVLSHEYTIRVKKKSFIFTTILTPILFAALCIAPSLIMMADLDDKVTRIAVADRSGFIADSLHDGEDVDYIPVSGNADLLKDRLDSLDCEALISISPLDASDNVTVDAYSKKQLSASVSGTVTRDIEDIIEKYKISKLKIDNFEELMSSVETDISLNTIIRSDDGTEKKAMVEINMAISFIMSFIIYMFVAMFGNMVMTSVINEKSNKIIEVIVSSVKPFELMIGKIVGVACVALTQFFIWVVLTAVLLLGFQAIAGPEIFGDPAAMQQMAGVSAIDMDQMAAMAEPNMAAQIFTALKDVNFPYILGCFVIFFILGYLLYASMFAAVGSAVDNEADTQQLVIPVTIPLIIGLLIMMQTFQNPDSTLSVWASIIPFTSPMVMLARIPFEGSVPLWQLLLSIGLLLGTFLVVVYFSAKIYRVGILMTGTKYSWKDLWKWLKY